jgi:hypothetical protein
VTSTPAAPTPGNEADKVIEATASQLVRQVQNKPVMPNVLYHSDGNGSDAGRSMPSAHHTQPFAVQDQIGHELDRLALDVIRLARLRVRQESATSLTGTILIWASLIVSLALLVLVCLSAWSAWKAAHSSSHANTVPPVVSTVVSGVVSGTVFYAGRRFKRGKASKSARSKASDASSNLPAT